MALTGLILHLKRKEEQGMAQCYGPELLPSPCPLPKLWLHSSGPSSLGLLLQASSRA